MKNDLKPTVREPGIDLLRILSMVMVLILHILGQGGVLAQSEALPAHNRAAWLLEIACYCAVNCYAMITGYVMTGRKQKPEKLPALWLQVAFSAVLTTAVRGMLLGEEIKRLEWLGGFFPVLSGKYWYFTAYFGMMLLRPYFDRMLSALTKQEHRRLVGILLVGFCLLPKLCQTDPFELQAGYSMLWLMLLYALGAYLRRFSDPEPGSAAKYLFGYGALTLLLWGNRMLMEHIESPLFGREISEMSGMWISYDSPFVVLQAVALLQMVRSLRIGRTWEKKLISFFAPLSFGVYLLHLPLFFSESWSGKFQILLRHSVGGMVWRVLALAAASFLIFSLADYVRLKLFRLLKLDRLNRVLTKS